VLVAQQPLAVGEHPLKQRDRVAGASSAGAVLRGRLSGEVGIVVASL